MSGRSVAATEAQLSASILRWLRLSVFLASLPFGMLVFGLPLIARELGQAPLRSMEINSRRK